MHWPFVYEVEKITEKCGVSTYAFYPVLNVLKLLQLAHFVTPIFAVTVRLIQF